MVRKAVPSPTETASSSVTRTTASKSRPRRANQPPADGKVVLEPAQIATSAVRLRRASQPPTHAKVAAAPAQTVASKLSARRVAERPAAAKRAPEAAKPATKPTAHAADADSRERMIREAAYALFIQRGFVHGFAVEDWLAAEADVDRALRSREPAK